MKVSKYISLTKATRLTEKGIMQNHGSGRGVHHALKLL